MYVHGTHFSLSQFHSPLGFNTTLESEIRRLEDEIFGILRNLENLTAGEFITYVHINE